MTSDQGWYLVSTLLVERAYRVRFEALVADLQRAGLNLVGPVEHGQDGTGTLTQ